MTECSVKGCNTVQTPVIQVIHESPLMVLNYCENHGQNRSDTMSVSEFRNRF